MKFITYKKDNTYEIGILSNDRQLVYPINNFGLNYSDMNDLINNITPEEYSVLKCTSNIESISINEITLMAPIPRPAQDIICLGINYAAHAEESARYKKEAFEKDKKYPIYFSKRVTLASAHGDFIPSYSGLVDSLDYESELAVIIGKDAKNVSEADAYNYVFGYTIINDVSARNLQTRHKQWYFGKSLDGFTPMGPCIVTKDEFSIPIDTKICSRVNGELRQNSTTILMITSISEAISELSQGMTLKTGTIIAMGTPSGVGMGFTPPRFLKSNDVVECEIEGIGTLKNTVL